jgi:catechol 2,3-dioxygenase-like lactoylglutathione lyase family enzyme
MLTGSTRLMNINHITYNVKNKDQALKWYQEVLGLKQIPKMVNSDHLYWLQLPSGAMVHIIENPNARPSRPTIPPSRWKTSRRRASSCKG